MIRFLSSLSLLFALALMPSLLSGCGPSDEVPEDQVEQHEADAADAAVDDETIP